MLLKGVTGGYRRTLEMRMILIYDKGMIYLPPTTLTRRSLHGRALSRFLSHLGLIAAAVLLTGIALFTGA